MQKLMGKTQFNEILGHLVYKPQGKITLVPNSDKRKAINKTTAMADFMEKNPLLAKADSHFSPKNR